MALKHSHIIDADPSLHLPSFLKHGFLLIKQLIMIYGYLDHLAHIWQDDFMLSFSQTTV